MTKFNLSKILVLTLISVLTASSLMFGNSVAPVLASPKNDDNVRICHASDSQTNPYQNPTVDPDSIFRNNGHDSHNGPVWYQGITDHSWGDIIPPFDYGDGQHYNGKNWTEGQTIWNNGCNIPSQEQTESLSCSINVAPPFNPGSKFEFGQTYNFSATVTGNVLNYTWSITPEAPALSSTNLPTTSWTAPLVPFPGITWVLTLNVSDDSNHSATCSMEFIDPPLESNTPSNNNDGGDGLGCATHDCSGNTNNNTQGQVLGASTMASAGSFEESLYLGIMALGGIFTFTGFKKASKKN